MKRYFRKFALAGALLLSAASGGCGQPDGKDTAGFTLADYLCLYTPVSCHGDLYKQVYLAPPDATYEITLNGKRLVVPMGYLDTTQLMKDPRYPVKTTLYLEMLLPDLAPHGPTNIREFFAPYERSKLSVAARLRGPKAMQWDASISDWIESTKRESNSPTHRPNKFGLQGWGEDFDKWPKRRPCANLGDDEPPCGEPTAPKDVWRPLTSNGTPSVMICDADILDDLDARIVAMPIAEREAYFADPKRWGGRRRAMCDHYMLYEPLNASVTLHYPRRFIAQWKDTEDRLRALLDSFVARGAAAH